LVHHDGRVASTPGWNNTVSFLYPFALRNPRPLVETAFMTVLPPAGPSLALRLLTDGIPPSLLIDLLDPEGMKAALAGELTPTDVALAPAPALPERVVLSA
jgi:hypothetical protein